MTHADIAYWNRHARNYDRSMAVLGKPLPRMLRLIAEAIDGRERVLEVAAGTGLVTATVAQEAREVVATDYAAEMVARLQSRVRAAGLSNVAVEQADLYQLRFEAQSFDAVLAANVLHLVPDLPGALAALRRVVKPGGVLVLPTFCHDETRISWALSRMLGITGFPAARRFTAESLADAVEATGLLLQRVEVIAGPIPITYVEAA
jgi:phosphatidylethanolamine/phosphatidyl-N-methylethanolamine N-methyltransferase